MVNVNAKRGGKVTSGYRPKVRVQSLQYDITASSLSNSAMLIAKGTDVDPS